LEALSHCRGVENYILFIGINPEPETVDELRDIAKGVTFAETNILVHPFDVGINHNKRWALTAAFEVSDYVIQIDDDILLAPDALSYFEWVKQFEPQPEIFTATAVGLDDRQPCDNYIVRRRPFFDCYAWATWKNRWPEILSRWPTVREGNGWSWDVAMHHIRGSRFELFPLVSRMQNIGREKGYMNAGHHTFKYWAGSDTFAGGVFKADYTPLHIYPPTAGFEIGGNPF
jgi:glycosyltransferase involved in cell wall biosynthesis